VLFTSDIIKMVQFSMRLTKHYDMNKHAGSECKNQYFLGLDTSLK
jgi:hypothetical protein